MSVPKSTIWQIEPHTQAKHRILEFYLQAWFPILGKYNSRINYIDGFAGPGKHSGGEEGSPLVALRVAKEHSFPLTCKLNFMFIEEDKDRASNLELEIGKNTYPKNFNINVINAQFHNVIDGLLNKLELNKSILAPTFAFIDPFGFSGIPFSIVERLLKIPSVEVFITFMKDSINRFITDPQNNSHIIELFGSPQVVNVIDKSKNRINDLRKFYQEQLKRVAKFVRYFEMRDSKDRPIYELFFATNHRLGHIKMKDAMWRFDDQGYFSFSDATNPNQVVLFKREIDKELFSFIDSIRSKNTVGVEILEEYIEDKTAYLSKYLKRSLLYAEKNKLITVNALKKRWKQEKIRFFSKGDNYKFFE